MIDESNFHLRSFGQMMGEMGILGVPRVIHKSLYQIDDVKQFLRDGIEEEIAAKEMCKELSDALPKTAKSWQPSLTLSTIRRITISRL